MFIFAITAALAMPPSGRSPDLQFDQVVLGEAHGCGRRAEGTVACWGRNDRGQLGDGTFEDSAFPRPVAGVKNVVALFAGSFHTCVTRKDRTVVCWGDNQAGQLGAGTMEAQPKPVLVRDLGAVLTLALGDSHTCAVTTDQGVSCWGNNLYGQLGMIGLRTVPRPVPVPGLPKMTDVAAGYGHTCASGAEGAAWCWGDPSMGQLGRAVPDPPTPQPPRPIDADVPVLRGIEARGTMTCGLHMDGVHCWGARPVDTEPRPAAERVLERAGLMALTVGWGHGCAWVPGREPVCFGDDRLGQLGATGIHTVVHGSFGLNAVDGLAAGNGETCAAPRGGRTVCWGSYTRDEVAASEQEMPEYAVKRERRLGFPPGTDYALSMQEVLGLEGTHARVLVSTVLPQPCANARIDIEVETKGKVVRGRIGDPFLPKGECINSPGPAVGTVDLEPGIIGRREIAIRRGKKEDVYQIYLRMNRLEVIPMAESFTIWDGAKALHRIPPGTMGVSCIDHLEAPICERRARTGLPTCAMILRDPKITQVPQLDRTKDYANDWILGDPSTVLISPDEGHEAYRVWFEQTWRDGSGCTDLRVRTWSGDVWTNQHPGNRPGG